MLFIVRLLFRSGSNVPASVLVPVGWNHRKPQSFLMPHRRTHNGN